MVGLCPIYQGNPSICPNGHASRWAMRARKRCVVVDGHGAGLHSRSPNWRMWLWLSKTVLGSHFGVGEFTTHFRNYFSGWIGMFTGSTIWLFTHGHVWSSMERQQVSSWICENGVRVWDCSQGFCVCMIVCSFTQLAGQQRRDC